MKRCLTMFVLLSLCVSTASAITIDEFVPAEGTVEITTENPSFESLLSCESVDDFDLLLYPNMSAFPLRFIDFACFNCTNTTISVSPETSEFLDTYFWNGDDTQYTNAEVLSAQVFVGLAMMEGGADYDAFMEQVSGYSAEGSAWNFLAFIKDIDTCQAYLQAHKDYLSEDAGFTGPLNNGGIPFSLGLTSKFDQDVKARLLDTYIEYWEGLHTRLSSWGVGLGEYEYYKPFNPFAYEAAYGLPYPGSPTVEEPTDPIDADAPNDVSSGDTSELSDISTENSHIDPNFGEDVKTGEAFVPENPDQYVDYMLGENGNSSTPEEKVLPERHYGIGDILLGLSVIVVIVCCAVFFMQDWVTKRRDPFHNYPRWR